MSCAADVRVRRDVIQSLGQAWEVGTSEPNEDQRGQVQGAVLVLGQSQICV